MTFERDNIARMQGYKPGEQPEDSRTIKLNTNENPYPPSPRVQKVINGFNAESLRRYPPATAIKFRTIAARQHGVSPENIIATRGGDELLRLLITTYVEPGQTIGMTQPTYSLYPVLAEIQNCQVLKVPLEEDWSLPDNFCSRVNDADCRLTFIVNPHAPTGSLLNSDTLSKLADQVKGILVIDEAYVDFIDRDYDAIKLIHSHPNIVILRTLSKGYSLAGLRFGYGIADKQLIEPMIYKTRDSYNLDTLGQQIAEAALLDQDYANDTWQAVISSRQSLLNALENLNFEVLPSQANFLLVTLPDGCSVSALQLYEKLKERHILVRYFDEDRLRDKLRITVGTNDENQVLMKSIHTILSAG